MKTLFVNDNFLDFHTHSLRRTDNKNIVEIVSLHLGEKAEHDLFTVGKHPWWTTDVLKNDEKELLKKVLASKNCLALGEIGLDKLKGVAMEQQIIIFKDLLNIASEIKKPVIIHCVRAFDKLISIKREYKSLQNWCIHGFSRHKTLATQLINEGFYISLMPTTKITAIYTDLVKSLPKNKFFLETDNTPNISIEEIYHQVATIRNISVKELKQQLNENARTFFSCRH